MYTRWFHRWALLAGWAVGMVTGTWMAASQTFKSPVYALDFLGIKFSAYQAVFALVANLIVSAALTLLLSLVGNRDDADETAPDDYVELRPEVAGRAEPEPRAERA